jgi:phosphoserine aminotransferase
MAKRRSFVPECPDASLLEGRVVLSTFGDIGNWFSSQYHHVTDDLGITHSKKVKNAAAGIEKLQKASQVPAKPAAHSAPFIHITSNDTVKA